jgi:transposase
VQRCRIVLAAAAGKSNQQIAGELWMPEVTVGKWRRCFANKGLEGLQDAPRSGRPVKYGQEVVQRVQTRTCQQPGHYSRWSVFVGDHKEKFFRLPWIQDQPRAVFAWS